MFQEERVKREPKRQTKNILESVLCAFCAFFFGFGFSLLLGGNGRMLQDGKKLEKKSVLLQGVSTSTSPVYA